MRQGRVRLWLDVMLYLVRDHGETHYHEQTDITPLSFYKRLWEFLQREDECISCYHPEDCIGIYIYMTRVFCRSYIVCLISSLLCYP